MASSGLDGTAKNSKPVKLVTIQPKVGLPPYKLYGENVPKTGTHCSNCEYLTDDKKHCKNENFIAWKGKNKPAGDDRIPGGDPDRYCSIWWYNADEEKKEEM